MDLIGSVVKGNNFHELDVWLETPTQAKLEELKAKSLYEICSGEGFMTSPAQRRHVEVEAFGGENEAEAWWGQLGSKEKILRGALIKAVEICLQPGGNSTKVVIYWVRGMANRMEAYVLQHDTEVVVLWLTPDAPMGEVPNRAGVEQRTEDIWAIASKARIERYQARYDGLGYDLNDAEDPFGDDDVRIFQIIGY